jgi:hypothetical protein
MVDVLLLVDNSQQCTGMCAEIVALSAGFDCLLSTDNDENKNDDKSKQTTLLLSIDRVVFDSTMQCDRLSNNNDYFSRQKQKRNKKTNLRCN